MRHYAASVAVLGGRRGAVDQGLTVKVADWPLHRGEAPRGEPRAP